MCIETPPFGRSDYVAGVAPRAGVWIETLGTAGAGTAVNVAPRAGVWIETIRRRFWGILGVSLPVRECGLKRRPGPGQSGKHGSLPVRECGLKQLGG